MNRCPDARSLLPAYVEGELSPIEQRMIRGHLEICSACRSEEMAFRSALGALKSAPRPAHGDLYAGLAARLDALQHRPSIRPRQLRWASALACLVLAVSVGAAMVGRTLFAKRDNDVRAVVAPRATQTAQPKRAPKAADAPDGVFTRNDPFAPKDIPGNSVEEDSPADTVGGTPNRSTVDDGKRRGRNDASNYANVPFRKVRDKSGRSVEDIIAELKRNNFVSSDRIGMPAGGRSPHETEDAIVVKPARMPEVPDVAVVASEKESRVQVGATVVKVRRETGYDRNGDLALIRLTAEPAQPSRTRNNRNAESGEDG